MQIIKFIVYFQNGVINTKISTAIDYYHVPNLHSHVRPCVTHAQLCVELRAQGITSEDIISVGSAVLQDDLVIIMENTPVKELNMEEFVKNSIKAKVQVEDSRQGLFPFARER